MIWEMSQDVTGPHSLYKVIENNFPKKSPEACGPWGFPFDR
jgi:hypothetical protein